MAAPGTGAVVTVKPAPGDDLSDLDAHYQRQAIHYMHHHADQLPSVVLARLGRSFSLYKTRQQLIVDKWESGRPFEWSQVGLYTYYVLGLCAIAGAVVLRRRSVPIFPLVSLVVTVVVATVLTFGQTRYRASAEVAIAVLGAVGIDALVARIAWAARRRRAEPAAPVPVSTPQDDVVLQ